MDQRGGSPEGVNPPNAGGASQPGGDGGSGRMVRDQPEADEGVGSGREPAPAGAGGEPAMPRGAGAIPEGRGPALANHEIYQIYGKPQLVL